MINATVYIATFHCVPNYGAVLQTYGLYKYLRTLFKEVRVLDYRPDTLLKEYRNINWYSLGSTFMSFWSLFPFLKKKKAFRKFEKRIMLTSVSGKKPEDFISLLCDYLFVGSDQIWNPNVTCGFDSVYFGYFPMVSHPKVISYAASLGKITFSDNELTQMQEMLRTVDSISVREQEAMDLLSAKFDLKSSVVADPTILAGIDTFKELVGDVQYEHYLFVYTLTNNPSTLQVAKQVAKDKGLRIIQVNGNRKPLRKPNHTIINDAGPEEFLSLLYHSDFVVTDSFHGTVFSCLFHVPFITIPHKTRGGRMVTLLSELGLTDRLTESSAVCYEDICWTEADSKIERMRQKSIEFINQSI